MPTRTATAPVKRGPPSFDELVIRVDHALRHIDDRIELNRNPLTRLTRVETLARTRYAACVHPQAVALRDMIDVAVRVVLGELQGEAGLRAVREFLALYRSGATVRQASKKLGLSREHCSRTVKKKAIALVAEKFMQLAMQRRPFPLPESLPLPQIEQDVGSRRVATSRR